ncbi:MAG: hypothetical protein WAL29_04165 [Bacteroidales bacterium]
MSKMGVSQWTLTGTTTSGVSMKVRGCDDWDFGMAKTSERNLIGK